MKTVLVLLGGQRKLRLRVGLQTNLHSSVVGFYGRCSANSEATQLSLGKICLPTDATSVLAQRRRCFSTTSRRSDNATTSRGPGLDLKAFRKDLYDMGKMLKRGDIAGVLAVFEELQESGSATHLHYNVAISALASSRDCARAGALFDELDARGEADAYTYGAYSSALCRAGKLDEAVGLVEHRVTTPAH